MVVVERQVDARSEGCAQHFVRLHIHNKELAWQKKFWGLWRENAEVRSLPAPRRRGTSKLVFGARWRADYSGHAMRP